MRRAAAQLAVVVAAAGCGTTPGPGPVEPPRPAPPQSAELGWYESYGEDGSRLIFGVERFEVRENGWSADISFGNDSNATWKLARTPPGFAFGLMLFKTNDLAELERLATSGNLPPVREATVVEPPLPAILRPGETWRGTISANGSLAADSWVRVTFGEFEAEGNAPQGMDRSVVWITDHAYGI